MLDVKTLCLGVVCRLPASGYQIRKVFESGPMSHIVDASYGSIYPALRQLSEDGLIEEIDAPEGERADKRLFRITPAGEQALTDALLQPPGRDRVRSDFAFTLCFAQLLPRAYLARILDARIHMLQDFLARATSCCPAREPFAHEAERFVFGMGLAICRAELAYIQENRQALLSVALPDADELHAQAAE